MQPLGRPPPPPPPPRHLILPLPRLHQCLRRKYATGGLALSFPDSAMPLLYPPLMQKPHDLPLLLAISSDANRRVRRLHATHPRRRRHHLLVQFEYELLPDDLFAVCNWSATHELHTWVLFQSTPSRRWLVRCDVDMEVLCSGIWDSHFSNYTAKKPHNL